MQQAFPTCRQTPGLYNAKLTNRCTFGCKEKKPLLRITSLASSAGAWGFDRVSLGVHGAPWNTLLSRPQSQSPGQVRACVACWTLPTRLVPALRDHASTGAARSPTLPRFSVCPPDLPEGTGRGLARGPCGAASPVPGATRRVPAAPGRTLGPRGTHPACTAALLRLPGQRRARKAETAEGQPRAAEAAAERAEGARECPDGRREPGPASRGRRGRTRQPEGPGWAGGAPACTAEGQRGNATAGRSQGPNATTRHARPPPRAEGPPAAPDEPMRRARSPKGSRRLPHSA